MNALEISGTPRQRWDPYRRVDQEPHAEVTVDADTAWRLFTGGIERDQVQGAATFEGDPSLGLPVLDMVSIIA